MARDRAYVPERGDFVRIVLNPVAGHEQAGERPVLVLSGQAFNRTTGLAFMAPVTGTRRGWPFEVPIEPGGRIGGVVLADQTKSLDYQARHARRLGRASDALVEEVLALVGTILEIQA